MVLLKAAEAGFNLSLMQEFAAGSLTLELTLAYRSISL